MAAPQYLRIGRAIERSVANGPGERFVVWVQGCSLHCPGCFNPGLQDAAGGSLTAVAELARSINAEPGIRGLTVSGGEPLDQPQALSALLRTVTRSLDIVIFTGYSWEEVLAHPDRCRTALLADLLVAGPFRADLATDDQPWAGSANKTVHALTGRIRPHEFPACRVEALIKPDASLWVTGFPGDFRV